ncbi:MAG: amidase family protein [Terracidiphilus sp.]
MSIATRLHKWSNGASTASRYNDVYRAVQTVTAKAALAEAGREDLQAKQPGFRPAPLWGVPIVIKANTSIAGLITSDGWIGAPASFPRIDSDEAGRYATDRSKRFLKPRSWLMFPGTAWYW